MTFSQVLDSLNYGLCFHRTSKSELLITKQNISKILVADINKLQSLSEDARAILTNNNVNLLYQNQMLVVNLLSGDATNYIPTIDDINATDWEVVCKK